jgi:hypothetical protein
VLHELPRNEHGYVTKKAVTDLTKGIGGPKSRTIRIGELVDRDRETAKALATFVEKYLKEPPVPAATLPMLQRARAMHLESLAVIDALLAGERPDTAQLRRTIDSTNRGDS